MSKKNTLLTFKGICMNFLLELKFFILSHPLTSKQPPKVVQIHMTHPVECGGGSTATLVALVWLSCLPKLYRGGPVYHIRRGKNLFQ